MRSVGLFGAGATLALTSALLQETPGSSNLDPPGATTLWATDRDGQRAYGLDADLLLTRRLSISWPVEIESCSDGGLWILRSNDGTLFGGDRLDRLSRSGELLTEVALEHCRSLATVRRDDALVIETLDVASGKTRALRFEAEGSLHVLLDLQGLECIASSADCVAVGTHDGRILTIDPSSTDVITGQAMLGGSIGDLAPGPRPGSFWALDVGAQHQLFLVEPDLSVRWSVTTAIAALHLAAVPGEERVWLVDANDPVVCRIGPDGKFELRPTALPLAGCDRAVAWSEGGLLIAAPGAILHLDHSGHLAPGQGGFDQLIDLEAVTPPAGP